MRPIFGWRKHPAESVIRGTTDRFRTMFTLAGKSHAQSYRTMRTENAIAVVKQKIETDPKGSMALELYTSTLWKILR